MDNREAAGVRRAITWLHDEAKKMDDVHAQMILNNAGFHLGVELKRWRGELSPTTAREKFDNIRAALQRD